MRSLRSILSPLLALAVSIKGIAGEAEVQVLLQGPDTDDLVAAMKMAGGRLTHELPLIDGIGGWVHEEKLRELAALPGVEQITEDFNPPALPDQRNCVVAGDLYVTSSDRGLIWRIHNFDAATQIISWIEADWPQALGEATVALTHRDTPKTEPKGTSLQRNQRVNMEREIPPGSAELQLSFTQWSGELNQNDLNITLGLPACQTELVRAYEDNEKDFYYNAESGATLLHAAGITGAGVGVAIVDTGLWEKAELVTNTQGERRIPGHFNAIRNRSDSKLEDLGGHGTHMASIIGNSRIITREGASGFLGVAPDADLIPVTAISSRGDGDFMDIIRGIQWVVEHKTDYGIKVLNLSLTATPAREYWRDAMNQAVIKAWAEGLLVVVAAGNDGPVWGTIGSPGNNPYVLTVGAFTDSWTAGDTKDDYIPDFSSRGPTPEGLVKPDLVAPGGHITGLVPPNSTLAQENPNYLLPSGHYVATGSSQAAAVVSGLAALLFQARPNLTNDQVKCLLKTSAQPAINRDGRLAYSPFEQGAGRANVARALTVGETSCDQNRLDVKAAIRGKERLYGPAERLPDGSPSLPGTDGNFAGTPSKKGLSADRRWGVAAHLERLDPTTEQPQAPDVSHDWGGIYQSELQKLQALQRALPAK